MITGILDKAGRDTRLRYTDFKVLRLLVVRYYNRATGLCIPSNRTLAEAVDKDVRSIQRSIKNLERYGYLQRQSRYMEMGGQTSNQFVLLYEKIDKNVTGEDDKMINIETNLSPGVRQNSKDNIEVIHNTPAHSRQNYYQVNNVIHNLGGVTSENRNETPYPPRQNYYQINKNVTPPMTTGVTPIYNHFTLTNLTGSNARAHENNLKINNKKNTTTRLRALLPVALRMFVERGVPVERGSHIIGRLVQAYGSKPVADALQALIEAAPAEPVAYLTGVLHGGPEARLSGVRYHELQLKQKQGDWLSRSERDFMEAFRIQQEEAAKKVVERKRQAELVPKKEAAAGE